MTVRIRMKKMGRRHRPFFRLCAVDSRAARDGRVIEYLGHYDPMVSETDARAVLKAERIDYWLSVGAQPSDKAKVLIKKYGTNGTHAEQQREALERLKNSRPTAPPPIRFAKPKSEAPAAEESATEGAADESATPPAEETAPAEENTAGSEAAGEEAAAEAKEEA